MRPISEKTDSSALVKPYFFFNGMTQEKVDAVRTQKRTRMPTQAWEVG